MQFLRRQIGDWLFMRAIERHGGRVGWRDAGKYTQYLRRAQRSLPARPALPPAIAEAVAAFKQDRVAAFATPETIRVAQAIGAKLDARVAAGETVWAAGDARDSNRNYAGNLTADFPELRDLLEGPLGLFLQGHFGASYKIFYGTLYSSTWTGAGPQGSALWHNDSGPGTCVNVMFYIDATTPRDGPLEVLPWGDSLQIFRRERAAVRRLVVNSATRPKHEWRDTLCAWYEETIAAEFADRIRQPFGDAGLVVPFANNTIHRGGFPREGGKRRAIVFHCYPSETPFRWDDLAARGLRKSVGYPKDPAEHF